MNKKTPRRRSAPKHPPKGVPGGAAPQSPGASGPAETSRPFPIVGVGASAGGLEAFSQLLRALPIDTGMAFVLVQHLDPTHESRLPDVLSRITAMPVITVTDGLRAEPNHVFVIPANADMTIGGGVFALTPRAKDHHMPIDHFLRSLAQEKEGRAIGVVLSGNGSDGTLGLTAIKAEGGIAFVQEEKSAKYPSMPHSALALADSVLPPEAIARELARISRHPYVNHVEPSPAGAGDGEDAADVSTVLRVLRAAIGVDFAQYKLASVRRRIARRMVLQKIDGWGAYVRYLRQTPDEAQALYDDLLIQVTGFFRDPEGFETLKRSVFPSLLKERAADEPIRIWVAGCATGEEAYSLVICLMEVLEEMGRNIAIQMFATDLSAAAVARARAGSFPASIENELSPDRLRRFFVKTDGRYQVSKAIRDVCVFAPQDVTRDPPFSKLDLISCCNVLIYLGAALQERVIPIFHYSLKPRGFLKLGPSEGVGRFTNLFSVIDKKHKLYGRKPGPSAHPGFGITAGDRMAATARADARVSPEEEAGWSGVAIEKEADRLVLGRYAPAGVVVNAEMEIVQFRGKTGPYLEATPGAASFNLFKMAREGLSAALRQAVHQAAKGPAPVKAERLRLRANGGIREVSLEVIPIGPAGAAKGRHYLILFFEERPRGVSPASAREIPPRPRTGGRRVAELTQELAAARQHLQAISEEHDAAMEELRATTEEAQSSNEELQSTNEELETAKEELQATNEELTTVNDELSSRNVELSQLNNDLANVLASTHVPIIMVGTDLRIRRMTPVTERILGVAPGDIGRPIRDLRLSVEIPDLESLLRGVIETLTLQEREVEARDGRWYSVRVRPYQTGDNKIEGAVISFVDIDALKRGFEQAVAIVETGREPLVILDADFRVVTANRSFFETFQLPREETGHQSLFDLGHRELSIPQLRALLQEVLEEGRVFEDFEIEHEFETIGKRTLFINARRMAPLPGRPALILLAIGDVTERRSLERARAEMLAREQAVRAEAEAATLAKDRFLAILSHELRTPLTAMLGWTRMLRTRNLDQNDATRALEVIERNVLLQARLIEDLLDVSRIVAGTMHLETRTVMVAPIVNAVLLTMQPTAQGKGLVLESALDEKAGPVRGDPARLQQILWNLLSNAIKFTPSGGRVDVHLARRGSAVEISVHDSGRGITAEELPKVFARFGMAHATTQSHGGMGLGLSIVRHLVELHGGTVRAESPGSGQGATFTVNLPLTDDRSADETKAFEVAARQLESGRFPALNGVRVLVVDDEDDTRELYRAILTQCEAEVTVAGSARTALEALERASFDVLVSDIVMPDEDGYDLIRQVRARTAERGGQIPALAITAYARFEDRTATSAAGYQQHVVKPIEPTELAAAVATLAGRAEPKRSDGAP